MALRPHCVVLRRCGREDGAGASNYDDSIADGWRAFFADLAKGAYILDLCTGNGAAALLAAEERRAARIVAVDQADIDPPAHVSCHAELYAAIDFRGGTDVEALPYDDGGFDAVVSQYGIEYSKLSRSIPEAVRMLGGVAASRLLEGPHGLIGHVVAARFL